MNTFEGNDLELKLARLKEGGLQDFEEESLTQELRSTPEAWGKWLQLLDQVEEEDAEDCVEARDRLFRVAFKPAECGEGDLFAASLERLAEDELDLHSKLNIIELGRCRLESDKLKGLYLLDFERQLDELRRGGEREVAHKAAEVQLAVIEDGDPLLDAEAPPGSYVPPNLMPEDDTRRLLQPHTDVSATSPPPVGDEIKLNKKNLRTDLRPTIKDSRLKAEFAFKLPEDTNPANLRAVLYVHSPIEALPGLWLLGPVEKPPLAGGRGRPSEYRYTTAFDVPVNTPAKVKIEFDTRQYTLQLYRR